MATGQRGNELWGGVLRIPLCSGIKLEWTQCLNRVDWEGFLALKYGEFGGIKIFKKFAKKVHFGAFASPFFFCLWSGKNLAKIKIKIIGLDLYESFQKRATPLAQVSHFFPPIYIYIYIYIYIAKNVDYIYIYMYS